MHRLHVLRDRSREWRRLKLWLRLRLRRWGRGVRSLEGHTIVDRKTELLRVTESIRRSCIVRRRRRSRISGVLVRKVLLLERYEPLGKARHGRLLQRLGVLQVVGTRMLIRIHRRLVDVHGFMLQMSAQWDMREGRGLLVDNVRDGRSYDHCRFRRRSTCGSILILIARLATHAPFLSPLRRQLPCKCFSFLRMY